MNNEITIDGVVYVRKDACSCPFMNKESSNKKYGFTGGTITYYGHILHRIIALKDFGNVRKGDIGGWIEREDNLSHEGNCWVDDDAKVWGHAKVYENALVYGYAKVFDNAEVYGYAEVCDGAWVHGNAEVCGYDEVDEDSDIFV